ncbi:hypothetical protein L3073_17635 [Ancylomarina sp. DW003]|nr:hypothetical protein [Ancylomarina sp. DW003]MDE5424041.1 hypothetical protein [Ancylomarina sp. DW003]
MLNNNGVYCAHEFSNPRLTFDLDEHHYKIHYHYLATVYQAESSLLGINYVDRLKEDNPDLKVIVLQRDKQETINSFINVLGIKCRTTNEDDILRFVREGKYIVTFDKTAATLRESIGNYYDWYYTKCDTIQGALHINLQDLNCTTTHDKIYDFIGLPCDGRSYDLIHSHRFIA